MIRTPDGRVMPKLAALGSHTYRNRAGELFRFWSLAPRFATNFAMTVPGMPRQFVWLVNIETQAFLHAVVCADSDLVLAVNPSQPQPKEEKPKESVGWARVIDRLRGAV